MVDAPRPAVDQRNLTLAGPALRAAVLCGLLVMVEGIDTYGISYVGPLLGREAGIAPQQMGVVFSVSVIASLLGAILVAPLSDRIGRRRVLLASASLAALGTLATPLAHGLPVLVALRMLVGLGFGATLPVALALTVEHAPPARRALLGTLLNSSVVVGAVLVAAGVALIVPSQGWRALMVAAGGVSLVAVLLAWRGLPESPQLALKVGRPGAADPRTLLQGGLAPRTLLLLVQFTIAYLVINFAVYWQPTLLLAMGYSVAATGAFGAISQGFVIVVAFGVGWLMDRWGPARVLLGGYALATLLFLLMSRLPTGSPLQIAFYLCGVSALSASVSGSLAFASGLYPATQRGTALGWVMGLARLFGGSGGTMVGGYIVAAAWTTNTILAVMGAAFGCAALALAGVLRATARDRRSGR
jgi:MFS transporter, AAHS family, 4-hydroxybenzoate transporter